VYYRTEERMWEEDVLAFSEKQLEAFLYLALEDKQL
jgi:hypothetical protein